jgi:hypothetical protein
MRFNNDSGAAKPHPEQDRNATIAQVRAALKARDREIRMEALRQQADDLMIGKDFRDKEAARRSRLDRSMMSDEEALANPADAAVEDEFTPYAGAMGQVDVTPAAGITMPIKGWNRFNRKRFKQAYDEGVKGVSGGFDKILQIIKPQRAIRPWDQERAVIESAKGNWKAGLPDKYDTVTGLMKQKAASDTREALKQRAERLAEIAAIKKQQLSMSFDDIPRSQWPRVPEHPKGGHYLGIEPLDNTIVKGAALHQDYDPLNASTGSKFNALRPPDFNPDPKLLQENIEIDARKRAAIDDLLSTRGLAPQSMYVRTPKTSYMVQDKAQETFDQAKQELGDELIALKKKNDQDAYNKGWSEAEHQAKDTRLREDYHKSVEDLMWLKREKQKELRNYVMPSDEHGRNMMLHDGKLKTVDSQGYLVPTSDPARSLYFEDGTHWMEPDPIPNDSRRAVTFKRGK